ncbi:MAG: SDR family oxidoreductase [Desulfobacterales bacterium]|nr:SDR family oxidoreductase [Desulfobacterales bacterium]
MSIVNKLRTFDGAVAIITGGASGIGRAFAIELAKRGAHIIIADLQIELAQEVVSIISSKGGKSEAIKIDVTDFPSVKNLVLETVKKNGRLDYMFNNAGIVIIGEVCSLSIDDWERIISVNLKGVIHGVQAAYPAMRSQGFGHIINTSSMAGLSFVFNPFISSYVATKYAVVGISVALRAEAKSNGIRVSVICPGAVRTPILRGGKFGKIFFNITSDNLEKAMEKLKPMPVDIFACKAVNSIAKNKAIIIIPGWWKIFWWLSRLSPTLGLYYSERMFIKANLEGRAKSNKNIKIV